MKGAIFFNLCLQVSVAVTLCTCTLEVSDTLRASLLRQVSRNPWLLTILALLVLLTILFHTV